MHKKHNLIFSTVIVLLASYLDFGTSAMLPNEDYEMSRGISGFKFRTKQTINPTSNTSISNDILDNCVNILNRKKDTVTTNWIKQIYRMVKNCNCPSDNFMDQLRSIPNFVDQGSDKMRCPYCNTIINYENYCNDMNCISHWNVKNFKNRTYSVGNKSGRRERLCLLPAIILEICKDEKISFYPPAKAWAIRQLIEGKTENWEYVDTSFNSLLYCKTEVVPKIKESLESAYKSITDDDVIYACLYYQKSQ